MKRFTHYIGMVFMVSKMKTKLGIIVLVVVFCVGLAGCGVSNSTEQNIQIVERDTPQVELYGNGLHTEVIPPSQPNTETPIVTAMATANSSKIAFMRDYGVYYGICIANHDGTDIKRITKTSSMNAHPTWSPNGTQIVFESNGEWHSLSSIYTINIDGSDIKCLTPEIKYCKSPSWSPDGEKIAYSVFKNIRTSCSSSCSVNPWFPDTIFIMDSDGKNKQNIGNGWYPSWFPDGQRIAFFLASRYGVISTINIDGSKSKEYQTRLTSYYLAGNYPTLSVSPNSKLVAFDSRDFTGKRDIYTLSPIDGTIKKLTGNVPASCYSPTWSPDGLKIAFTLEVSSDLMGHTETDIYVMDSDGGNPTLMIEDGMFPSWSR